MNFNEVFRKNLTYDDIQSDQKLSHASDSLFLEIYCSG